MSLTKILYVSASKRKFIALNDQHMQAMIWPMSIIMRAMTSTSDNEIRWCIKTLRDTDAGTGFMHETFHKNNPENFTRSWFVWANTLFGELILKLINQGKQDLLKV